MSTVYFAGLHLSAAAYECLALHVSCFNMVNMICRDDVLKWSGA